MQKSGRERCQKKKEKKNSIVNTENMNFPIGERLSQYVRIVFRVGL